MSEKEEIEILKEALRDAYDLLRNVKLFLCGFVTLSDPRFIEASNIFGNIMDLLEKDEKLI